MLIVRAPLRLSFFGGGTDLPAYYRRYGGAVLSTTIDKYVYVVMNVSPSGALQIMSSDYRTFFRLEPGQSLLWDGDLSLPRAVLQHFGVEGDLSMFVASEVPPGTGLGSSSAVTVALIKGVAAARGYTIPARQLAELACEVEIEKLGQPIGVQDQYAAAFGGLNWMTFSTEGIEVEPLDIRQDIESRLLSRLLLVFTGSARSSAEILTSQRESTLHDERAVLTALHSVKELAYEARRLLERGELDRFGSLLDEAWQHKRRFAQGITNPLIDRCYALARESGALGGKIAGAGGGGFLILLCREGMVGSVETALATQGLKRMDFCFESDGARVLLNAGLRLAPQRDDSGVPVGWSQNGHPRRASS